jgi:hypothetical protein
MRKLLAVALLALTAACAVTPQSPQQAVFAAKQDYAVALTVAVAYRRLPACGPAAPPVCSDKAVVTRLQKADDAAAALLDGAEATVRAGGGNVQMAITAAQQAVAALTSVTQTLGVKR